MLSHGRPLSPKRQSSPLSAEGAARGRTAAALRARGRRAPPHKSAFDLGKAFVELGDVHLRAPSSVLTHAQPRCSDAGFGDVEPIASGRAPGQLKLEFLDLGAQREVFYLEPALFVLQLTDARLQREFARAGSADVIARGRLVD